MQQDVRSERTEQIQSVVSVKERHGNSEGKNGDNLTGQFTGEGRDRKSRKLKKGRRRVMRPEVV